MKNLTGKDDAVKETLRCMAEGRGDEWFAICIDLDIAVQGRSFHEVRGSLESAIDMYLERVAELSENERPALLNRRSPWLVRAKFAIVSFLSHFDHDGGTRRPFILPAHRHAHA